MRLLVLIAAAACSAEVCAVSLADEISSLRAEIQSNSIDRTTRCAYYRAWYADQCDKAELDAILERNVAAHRRWMELEPKNPFPHMGLGDVYASLGRWDKALPELSSATNLYGRVGDYYRAQVLWNMANCLWAKGDKAGAKRLLGEIAAKTWTGDIPECFWKAQFLARNIDGRDVELDSFNLPHSVDGKPFPTPQEAEYGDERVSLARVELRVMTGGTSGTGVTGASGLASPAGLSGPGDPIVRLLKRKLQRFGSKFEKGGTPVTVEISPDAPVEKPQGYSLDVAPGSVRVRARTRLGATWGVVSLIQCVDRGAEHAAAQDGKPSIKVCSIRDWPECERRGVIDYWAPGFLEYALFNKMTTLSIRMDSDYSPSPLDRERYRIYASQMREFGIELYAASSSIAMRPLLPLTSPRVWKLHYGWARFLASVGMGFSFHLDDHRFPVHPADLAAAGTAANLDAKYVTRLYRETKKDYPGFIMQFCPPFYWGPNSPVSYPEKRDPYLKSLGAELDPAIDVYWTGGSVKSERFTAEKVKWFADLIGRKPTVFHNGNCIGQHNYIQYGADTTGYKESHESGIFAHLAAFQHNMSTYRESSEIGSAMDWCWNPEAHDPAGSVRRSDEQLEGPGVYEAILAATPALSYFDRYEYGEPRSELFAEDQDALDRRVSEADAAWKKVLSVAKNGGLFVGGFNRGLGWARRLADMKRNPPKWLVEKHEAEMANTSFAESEVDFDAEKGDMFIPSEMLSNGHYYTGIGDWTARRKRAVKYVDVGVEVTGSFQCEPFPPSRPFTLLVQGMSWREEKPIVEIEVNGRVVWRGEAFTAHYFKPMEFEIPVDALARNNRFGIRNVSPVEEHWRRPIIHYVVIRKQGGR